MFVEDDWGLTSKQIQDIEDEIEEENQRRAKIKDLRTQVQTLQARLDARDAIIRSQQAKIRRLQGMPAQRSRVVIGQQVEA